MTQAFHSGTGRFIWLDPTVYPDMQETPFDNDDRGSYCVAEFTHTVALSGRVRRITLDVTGAAQYFLWCNGRFVGLGPASAGGDFLASRPLSWQYVDRYTYHADADAQSLKIRANVRLRADRLTEFTPGKGCFLLSGTIEYEDGTTEAFGTDDTWLGRVDRRYPAPGTYDATAVPDEWSRAALTDVPARLPISGIPNLAYTPVYGAYWTEPRPVHAGETYAIDYPRIHCAYLALHATGACTVELGCSERGGSHNRETVTFGADGGAYRGLMMYSAGYLSVKVISAAENVRILPYLIDSRYPITAEGTLHTSDPALDKVYDVCKWTLSICRQSLHLDSPSHQELLACTGDYLVETNMTLFTFGDMRLAAQDIRRTADWLMENDGRMFHTSYSLMWVQWIRKVYTFTGDRDLIRYCRDALDTLLTRFHGYIGKNGILDNAPDYMFIDWLEIEGYNMHHPPKSLGQTVLCAFYYKALTDACALCRVMEREPDGAWWTAKRASWASRMASFRPAFHRALYDAETGLYIDGLPDEDEDNEPWRPKNVPLKHFTRHANVLAAMYGLCPEEERERILRRSVDLASDLQQVQPYYMYFILEAVWENGLFGDYGMRILDLWKPLVETCDKGLQEGWFAPPDYSFDYSHAWGGTPAYHLPLCLTGLRIVEPGFKKITLSPRLWGLSSADVSFPTPYGQIRVYQKAGEEPRITVPDGIEWEKC